MKHLIKSLLTLFFVATTASVWGQTGVELDLIPVQIEGKWGYIDLRGNIVIDPRFDTAEVFHDGLAKVTITQSNDEEEVYGFINRNGHYVAEPKYIDATYFSEGIAFVINPDMYIEAINTKGETIFQLTEDVDLVTVFRDPWAKIQVSDGYRFINKLGDTKLTLQHLAVNNFSEGLCAVLSMDEDNDESWKWGYVDTSGKTIIPARFEFAEDFQNGQAVVKEINAGYGVIDRKGNYIIEPIYEYIIPDEDEFIFIQKERFGRMNQKGEITLKPNFGAMSVFRDGMAVAYPLEGNICGYIDRSGNYLIEPKFALATLPKDDMMLVATENGNWKLIDKKGNDINTPGYDIEHIASDYLSYSIYSDNPFGRGSFVMSANSYSKIEEVIDLVVDDTDYYLPEEPVDRRKEEVFEGNEIIIPGTKQILIVTGPSEPDFPCIGVGFHHPFGGGSNTYIEVKRRGEYFQHRENGSQFHTLEKALEDGLKDLFLHHFYDEEIWNRFLKYGGLKIFLEQAKEYIDDEFLDSGWNEKYG